MKKWYKSKTIIFNLLAILAGALLSFGADLELNPYILLIATIVQSVANLFLRVITTEGVEL